MRVTSLGRRARRGQAEAKSSFHGAGLREAWDSAQYF